MGRSKQAYGDDGQRFKKKHMNTQNSQNEASTGSVRPSSVSKHQANRGQSMEAVLSLLRAKPTLAATPAARPFRQPNPQNINLNDLTKI
jgi:hypothetical protein